MKPFPRYYCCLRSGETRTFFRRGARRWTECAGVFGAFPARGVLTLEEARRCVRSATIRDLREPGDKIQIWVEPAEFDYRIHWQDPPLHPLQLLAQEAGDE